MDQLNIQWFPGHMTKARRMMQESIQAVDALCEVLDARIPNASRNPEIDSLAGGKPRLIVLNRADLADPAVTALWKKYYESMGFAVLDCDARTGKGTAAFAPAVRALLADRIEAWSEKGQTGRKVRVMVAGIPNVGKSTFINRVARRKAAAAGLVHAADAVIALGAEAGFKFHEREHRVPPEMRMVQSAGGDSRLRRPSLPAWYSVRRVLAMRSISGSPREMSMPRFRAVRSSRSQPLRPGSGSSL